MHHQHHPHGHSDHAGTPRPSGPRGAGAHEGMGHGHHNAMVQEFRRRFWISLVLTLPVVALAEVVQGFVGVRVRFPGDHYVQLAFATAMVLVRPERERDAEWPSRTSGRFRFRAVRAASAEGRRWRCRGSPVARRRWHRSR